MVREAIKTQLVDELDYGLGLSNALNRRLKENEENARVICEYVKCLGVEINPYLKVTRN